MRSIRWSTLRSVASAPWRRCPICGQSIEEVILQVQILRLSASLLLTLTVAGLLLLDRTDLIQSLLLLVAGLTLTDIFLRVWRLRALRRKRRTPEPPSGWAPGGIHGRSTPPRRLRPGTPARGMLAAVHLCAEGPNRELPEGD